MKRNIAIAGGPCTGRSTLAAALFAKLKQLGLDYDYIEEQSRMQQGEFGFCRSPFERLYLWIIQNRSEMNSVARDGFVTDAPLFHMYVQGRIFEREPRDRLAVLELLRLCLDIKSRYQLIVIAADTEEIPYKRDRSRRVSKKVARIKHRYISTFVEHFYPDRVVFVRGSTAQRVRTVLRRLKVLRGE